MLKWTANLLSLKMINQMLKKMRLAMKKYLVDYLDFEL